MIDLSTNYLGLKLKNPLVVSASPLSEKLENFRRMEMPARPPSCCTRCSRSRSKPRARTSTPPSNTAPTAMPSPLQLPARPAEVSCRAGSLSRPAAKGKEVGRDSGHRQPQRQVARRLARATPVHGRGGRRRAGAEHLQHPDRSVDSHRAAARRRSTSSWCGPFASRSRFPSPSSSGPTSPRWRTLPTHWTKPAPTAS